MKLAIISDIHGNMEALNEVLIDIDKRHVDAMICLGDMVGYGPEPEEVIRTIIEREIPTIMGNHELAIIDTKYLEWFNPLARLSIRKTIPMLSEVSMDYIADLAVVAIKNGARFVHGFPPDSVITYLFQIEEPAFCSTFEALEEDLCFVGHTHKLEIVSYGGGVVIRAPLKEGIAKLHRDKKYIINVGSVGQPRDGNNNAKYMIWDTTENSIELRFVPYHIAQVTNKIIEAGLPEAHAERLW
jgi:predicted phosphodiesterase